MRDRRTKLKGVTPDAERSLESLFRELDDRLRKLEGKAGRAGFVGSDTAAVPGEFLNIEAPAAGLTVILPEATPALRNARVTLAFRNTNPVRIVAILGTVNRESFVINTAVGVFEAICNGLDGWEVETGLSSTGSSVDAEFIVGAAHGSLPSARVATDSTEVDVDLGTPGVASWALRTASVVFGKLANLTGLSVLGRAANSAGVMAAITATAARQTLRANDAGTALEWGHPVEFRNNANVDQGDGYSVQVVDGANTTSSISLNSGVATIAWSVDDLPASALADVNGGTFLGNITNSSGPVTANQLSILAGSGLTYGLGVMAVGAGSHITVGASDVGVDVASLLDAIDSTSIVVGSSTLQRAALTGEVTAAQNSNATTIVRSTDFDWTGEHWFSAPVFFDDPTTTNIPTLGDIRGMTVEIYARSQLDLGTTAGSGDINIQSGLSGVVDIVGGDVQLRGSGGYAAVSAGSDGVFLTGGSVYVSSGTDTPGSGGTSAGFIRFKGGSASTPSVGSGDGMHWVSPQPWGTGASVPRFTDDSNTDHECATIGPLTTIRTVGSGDVKKGTVFSIVKEIVSSGAAGAGDAAIFNSGDLAPFAFRILLAGYFPTTTPGAAATVTLRDSGGGGGLTLGAPMDASTPGTYANWFGGATTVDPVVSAGGTLIARCSRRDFSGVLWMLCIRT
jgi:hypothetical protein